MILILLYKVKIVRVGRIREISIKSVGNNGPKDW